MSLPLRIRLALMTSLVLAGTIALVVVAVGVAVDRVLIAQTAERLEIGAGLLVDRPRQGPPVTELAASEVATLLGGQGTAVTILTSDGSVLAVADNGAPPAVASTRLESRDYAEALATGETTHAVVDATGGRVLVVAAPIRLTATGRVESPTGGGRGGPPFVPPGQAKRGVTPAPSIGAAAPGASPTTEREAGPPNAIAQLSVSLLPVDDAIGEIRSQLAWLGALALAIGLAATILITARATRPLDRVVLAATRLADGDLTARTGVAGTDEVGAVGQAFDSMAARLEAAFAAQRAFAADASHELRTPLTVLGGYVDVLRRGETSPDERSRLLASMRREIDRLSRLAGDLLLLARLEAGTPALEPRSLDLADLVREQVEAARMLDSTIPVDGTADVPLPVFVDPDRMTGVLRNLLENAVRHAAPGTSVRVRAATDGSSAIVDVENDGEPIDPDVRARVFDRFVQGGVGGGAGAAGEAGAAPRRAGPGQAGLGLAIAKAVVTSSGGSIEAEGDDRVTRFRVRLPLHRVVGSQRDLSDRRVAPA
jgi:two-component system OmpR family sensor kinase